MEKGNSPVPIPAAPCLAPEGPRLRGLLPDPQATWQRRRAPFPATPSPTRIPEKAPWHSTCVLSHPPPKKTAPAPSLRSPPPSTVGQSPDLCQCWRCHVTRCVLGQVP